MIGRKDARTPEKFFTPFLLDHVFIKERSMNHGFIDFVLLYKCKRFAKACNKKDFSEYQTVGNLAENCLCGV
jgi:hypothetical protein